MCLTAGGTSSSNARFQAKKKTRLLCTLNSGPTPPQRRHRNFHALHAVSCRRGSCVECQSDCSDLSWSSGFRALGVLFEVRGGRTYYPNKSMVAILNHHTRHNPNTYPWCDHVTPVPQHVVPITYRNNSHGNKEATIRWSMFARNKLQARNKIRKPEPVLPYAVRPINRYKQRRDAPPHRSKGAFTQRVPNDGCCTVEILKTAMTLLTNSTVSEKSVGSMVEPHAAQPC